MSTIRVLSTSQIESVFTLKDAITSVEQAYLQKYNGVGELWPMVFHDFETGVADLDIKSGNLDASGVFGFKLVSWFADNAAKSLPALFGTVMLFDRATGEPKALLNGGAITELRTGAAGAVGAKLLARKDSKNLLMAGYGSVGIHLIAAALLVMPELETVTIINPHNPAKSATVLPSIIAKVDELLAASGTTRTAEIVSSDNMEDSVRNADIIFTATPAREPFIKAEWVQPGTHLSCVGADMSGKQEVDSNLFKVAKIFGDDEDQCLSVGECEVPHKSGLLPSLPAEIGAVLAGDNPGRTNDEEITLFDSTGIALQDLAAATEVLKKAEEQGLGSIVEL